MSKSSPLLYVALAVAAITNLSLDSAQAAKGRTNSVTCIVDITHEFRSQDGAVVRTETYQQEFVVEEGAIFVDDYSTPTREKVFTASLQVDGNDLIVVINWFADVSTFDAVDLDADLTVTGNKPATTSGRHAFFSSAGRNTTTYTLSGVRN